MKGEQGRVRCEFALIRYVPDPVKGEFVNIGVLLREVDSRAMRVRFTRDWSRVRCVHSEADVMLLESLEAEIAERARTEAEQPVQGKTVLEVLEDTLSNSVQLTAMQATLAESPVAAMEQLLTMYVESMGSSGRRRKPSGRTVIAGRMRDAFQQVGVWDLMRKGVAASQYTRSGDPLRIDCGYRNGRMRFFQAVSLGTDAELAKSLAYSSPALRAGVERLEGTELELTAVVEPISGAGDRELYTFGVSAMEDAGVRVLTTADLTRVAETARRELRV